MRLFEDYKNKCDADPGPKEERQVHEVESGGIEAERILGGELANLKAAEWLQVLEVGCFERFSPRCSTVNNKVK